MADLYVSRDLAARGAEWTLLADTPRWHSQLRHCDHLADGNRADVHDPGVAEAGPLSRQNAGACAGSSEDQGQTSRRPDEAASGRAGALQEARLQHVRWLLAGVY